MLTGDGGEESEVRCLEAGANDFVTKPINACRSCARGSKHNCGCNRSDGSCRSKTKNWKRGAKTLSATWRRRA